MENSKWLTGKTDKLRVRNKYIKNEDQGMYLSANICLQSRLHLKIEASHGEHVWQRGSLSAKKHHRVGWCERKGEPGLCPCPKGR